MKTRKHGDRHPLLLYRRTLDRIWKMALLIGLLLGAVWVLTMVRPATLPAGSSGFLLLVAAVVALVLSVLVYLARFTAYSQVYTDHFRIVTPLLRLNVSYQRLRTTHPVLLQQLFPMDKAKWAERKFLEPLYGKTAVVVELKGYPMKPALLKLFLPAQMFSPQTTGLVMLVPDWMKFSTELDVFHGNWLQSQTTGRRMRRP